MASTKDIKRNLENSSFLFIGDGGTGKTRLAGSFPSPYFFDFDKGLASLAGRDGIEYDTFKDATNKSRLSPEEGIYPWGTGWQEFEKKANLIGDMIDKETCPYKTLVMDSGTTMSDLCMNYVLKQDPKATYGSGIQIQHWGRQSELMKTVLDQLTSWPLIKIFICHAQRTTNDLMQTVEMLPLLTGKFAAKAPIYFDEVYYTQVDRPADKTKPARYYLQTQSTAIMKSARSRFGVPDGIDSSWTAINKALEKVRPVGASTNPTKEITSVKE